VHRLIRAEAWPEQAIINYEEWRAALALREQSGLLPVQTNPEKFIENKFATAAIRGIN
jgi:hypothetical protein